VKVRSLGRIINHLIDIEALDADARGRLRPNRSMLLADILEESQATVEHEQALQSSRVAMVRDYAETDACRRQVLLSYFGEAIQPCGNCDNCQAGTPESTAANDQTEREVEHAEWGKGHVLRVENDRAYVFFDTAGYRVVDLVVAEERDLLRWLET
jgi:ATP-dependent DNA helicase RecQ